MKKLTVTTLIIAAFLSPGVMAHNQSHSDYDYARVTSVTPVYDYVEHRVPIQTCEDIDYRHHAPERGHSSVVPIVVGGVIGGVVGHTIVGSSRTDKQIGTIAGTVIGATIGSTIETGGGHHRHEPIHRCSTTYQVEYEKVLIGYDVTYQYRDHRYHTHTKHHPGKNIRLPEQDGPHRKHREGHSGKFAVNPGHHDRRY